MWKLLRRLFVGSLFFFIGMRFYTTKAKPVMEPFRNLHLVTPTGENIMFYFYRGEQRYVSFNFGFPWHSDGRVYIVKPVFDPRLAGRFGRMDEAVYIRYSRLFLGDEEFISRLLTLAYVEFMQLDVIVPGKKRN